MRKKYYIKPLIEVLEMDIEELMKVGSVTDVITPSSRTTMNSFLQVLTQMICGEGRCDKCPRDIHRIHESGASDVDAPLCAGHHLAID